MGGIWDLLLCFLNNLLMQMKIVIFGTNLNRLVFSISVISFFQPVIHHNI